jgi:assimilatory nitrate reductase catalytic subunit
LTEHLALLAAGGGGAGHLHTDEERLASLQATLQCGTNCGSCVPELKRRVRSARTEAAGAATALRDHYPAARLSS